MKCHVVTLQDGLRVSPARGRKSKSHIEAKLSSPKGVVPNNAGELAVQRRRVGPRCRDSAALGDCTQALVRLTPSQGVLPDGMAGMHPAVAAMPFFM